MLLAGQLRDVQPEHGRALRLLGGDPEGKLHLLGDFSGRGAVSDPWYTGDFARTFDDIAAGVAALIDKQFESN